VEGETRKPEIQYVGFWLRLVASILDTALVTTITFPVLIRIYGFRHTELQNISLARGPADFLISYVAPAILVIGFWHFKLATPGKMAVSAVVVDADNFGRPSTLQLIVRYAGYFLSTIFLFLGFLWIAFDGRKQGWHDKLARTVVVRTGTRETD
jgi:uncharacterized RDD family membrane protein YckC